GRRRVKPDGWHGFDRAHRDGERAFSHHRVPGVGDHVDQCRIELAGVGVHTTRLLGELENRLDSRATERSHHPADGIDVFTDAKDFRLKGLSAREGEQLPGEPGGTIDRL
nr:hypothetical protein [Tanacetum cinerariifolium]